MWGLQGYFFHRLMLGVGEVRPPPIRIPYTLPRATRCKALKDLPEWGDEPKLCRQDL